MKKVLISLLFGSALIACSTNNAPKQQTIVINSCSEAQALVKSNHQKIHQAFADNDATTIGTLELQNRAIFNANMQCFPKMKAHIEQWKKMHSEM